MVGGPATLEAFLPADTTRDRHCGKQAHPSEGALGQQSGPLCIATYGEASQIWRSGGDPGRVRFRFGTDTYTPSAWKGASPRRDRTYRVDRSPLPLEKEQGSLWRRALRISAGVEGPREKKGDRPEGEVADEWAREAAESLCDSMQRSTLREPSPTFVSRSMRRPIPTTRRDGSAAMSRTNADTLSPEAGKSERPWSGGTVLPVSVKTLCDWILPLRQDPPN